MKKYVTLGNVLGLIGALVALLVLGLLGHWILSTITAIFILAAVWTPGNLITSWLKAAFAAIATFTGIFAITHTGIIYEGLNKALPASTWLIPLVVALIVAIVGCVFAWNNRSYYEYNGGKPFDDEDDDGELEGYTRVIDLTCFLEGKELSTVHVWVNKETRIALVVYRDNRWELNGEYDKVVEHNKRRTAIAMEDGTLLRIPSCKELNEALA